MSKQLISDETLMRDNRYTLVAVRVKSVDSRDATNGRPPTVVLEVIERFRGESRRKTLTVKWPATPPDEETDPKKRAKWLATAFAGPTVNAELIVLIEKSDSIPSVLTERVFPYSPAERARVMKLARITKALGDTPDF